MTEPRVSVCVLSYNHAPFVERALQSVLEQQAPFDFEVVLADDCSPDGTLAIAERILSNSSVPFRILPRRHNLGVRANFINLLASARGTYVAFLESDDYWTCSSKLAEQVALLDREPTLVGCYGRANVVDANDLLLADYFKYHHYEPPARDIDQRTCIGQGASGPACTYLFRRSALCEMPSWFLQVGSHQALLVVLTEYGLVRFVDSHWGNYRVHPGGVWSLASSEHKQAADFHYAIALAGDASLTRRYPSEIGARVALSAYALSRERLRAGRGLSGVLKLVPELLPAIGPHGAIAVLRAAPALARLVVKKGLIGKRVHDAKASQ